MERVFRRHWHCLAHQSVIPNPGNFELFRLGDEQVILTHSADGTIHALLNVCRHRGAEVCTKEKGNAKFFVCPYHAWTYSNEGSLRAARLMPKDFDRSQHGLKKLHVRVASGLVFISFAERPSTSIPSSNRCAQAVANTAGARPRSPIASVTRCKPTGNSRSRTMSSAITAARRIRNILRRMRWNSRLR